MNVHRRRTLQVLGFAVPWSWPAWALSQAPLRIAKADGSPNQIISGKVLEVIYERAGIPMEVVAMPTLRALVEAESGRVDGLAVRIFEVGEEASWLVRVPTPIGYLEPVAFAKRPGLYVPDLASLRKYRLGIVRGSRFAELLVEGVPDVFAADNATQLMRVLDSGRIDLAIVTRINGLWVVQHHGLSSLRVASPVFGRPALHHYLHIKHRELVPRVDRVVRTMVESGELQRLRDMFTDELLKSKRY